ncbi:MAG: hypothetical protein M1830_000417 [Pleopsidium flavum]|nr:MAG: hypothetical protein M1830_000417 [Pleopsidium flavum]
MNANGFRHASYGSSQSSRYGLVSAVASPPPKVLLDGYKGSFEDTYREPARYGTHNKSRPRSSALLNIHDPVAMHLLMETAIEDSQEYEVLSFEEVDAMKRECSFLYNRIEATKRKLTLETKLRDAAQSLNRLNSTRSREGSVEGSPNSGNKHRRSIMGSRGSGSDLLNKTGDELLASTRKCEELAQELWRSEKRIQELQRKLLQHTAGILQITHRGILKKSQTSDMLSPAPETTAAYSFSSGIHHTIDGADDFDDRSFYRSLDALDEFGGDYDQSGNNRQDVQSSTMSLSPVPPSNTEFVEQTQAIDATELKLEDLNHRLREMIVQANVQKHEDYSEPPKRQPDGEAQQPGAVLQAQLEYLEHGLSAMDSHQSKVLRNAERSIYTTEERLEGLNARLHSLVEKSKPDQTQPHQPPPRLDGRSLEAQITYLGYGLDTLAQQLQELASAARASSTRSAGHQEKAERYETVLKGLWEILTVAGAEPGQYRKQDQRDQSLSFDEDAISHGGFSLQGFSARVQSLYARATGLQEQKDILTRQVQQQRELNSKPDAQKDAQFSQVSEELEHTKMTLADSHQETKDAMDELGLAMTNLDAARQEAILREQQKNMTESNALKAERAAGKELEEKLLIELKSKQDEILQLNHKVHEIKDEAGIARANMYEWETKIQELMEELDGLRKSKEATEGNEAKLRGQVDEKTKETESVQEEMSRLEGEVVRLQTEVTVARAELDGAYGTRAQRAAEVAANPALQRELDELVERNMSLLKDIDSLKAQNHFEGSTNQMQSRVETLQRELTETICEYESVIKSSIEFEKEREQLESMIDGLRDRCEILETQLSEEKVKSLGTRSPGTSNRDSGPTETTSTMVLKNEFKKMMRDTRVENTRALRVSEARQRRARGAAEARSFTKKPEKRPDPDEVDFESEHDGTLSFPPADMMCESFVTTATKTSLSLKTEMACRLVRESDAIQD